MRAILTYHSIDPSGSPISVAPEAFARHVRWLASGAVRVVSLDELLELDDAVDAVALTFDDAFRNLAEVAWPLLADHGLTATVYVVSDHVGATNAWEAGDGAAPVLPLADWEDLGRMAEEGLAIGVHGRRHRSLVGLPEAALEDEVLAARARLRRELGSSAGPAASFAYPYGDHDDRSTGFVARHFTTACTTRLSPLASGDDPHRLPRLDAYYLRSPGRLETWGDRGFRLYLAARGAARTARLALRRAAGLRRPV